MNGLRAVAAATILLAIAATPAVAQHTANHEGFWLGFGFGGGSVFGDDFFDGDSKFGGAGFLRMGGSPSQQFIIGGELIGWGTDQEDTRVGRGALMATALYYPSDTGGLFLKGSAGFAGRTRERTVVLLDGGSSVEATITDDKGGIGLGAGLGYDIQVARNFFLTPGVDYVFTGTEDDSAGLLLFTVGASWH